MCGFVVCVLFVDVDGLCLVCGLWVVAWWLVCGCLVVDLWLGVEWCVFGGWWVGCWLMVAR